MTVDGRRSGRGAHRDRFTACRRKAQPGVAMQRRLMAGMARILLRVERLVPRPCGWALRAAGARSPGGGDGAGPRATLARQTQIAPFAPSIGLSCSTRPWQAADWVRAIKGIGTINAGT